MKDRHLKHLDSEALDRWLSQDNDEGRSESLLHLLATCPECHRVGGYILDLYQADAIPLVFSRIDLALARSRVDAPGLWEELAPLRFAEQSRRVQTDPRYRSWGLGELLCKRSREIASESAAEAVELAELAVLVSNGLQEGEPVEDHWMYELRALAWAHLGNARRVQGDLRTAKEAFSLSDQWWDAGSREVGDPLDYEPELQLLKVSLLTAERHFQEGFQILDSIIQPYLEDAEHRGQHLAGRAMVMKAFALAEMGEPEASISLLREASPLLDPRRDARLVLCARYNLLENLTRLGRFEEAREGLLEVRSLLREWGKPLDHIRLRWVEGRIAAGVGERELAAAALDEVRQQFLFLKIAYDTALVSLELAVLYLEDERTAEVKELALALVPVFQSQDVHREALAALAVFQSAALVEAATAELAREVADYLEKARHEPGLAFRGER